MRRPKTKPTRKIRNKLKQISDPNPMTPLRRIKRIAIGIVGGTVLVIGIALIVLPGPAFVVIPAGLAILAVEFAWARRWLNKARAWFATHRTPPPQKPGVMAEKQDAVSAKNTF